MLWFILVSYLQSCRLYELSHVMAQHIVARDCIDSTIPIFAVARIIKQVSSAKSPTFL